MKRANNIVKRNRRNIEPYGSRQSDQAAAANYRKANLAAGNSVSKVNSSLDHPLVRWKRQYTTSKSNRLLVEPRASYEAHFRETVLCQIISRYLGVLDASKAHAA